jgi:signal transduction histidine kinase/ligand-binding sensor domain-containing protein
MYFSRLINCFFFFCLLTTNSCCTAASPAPLLSDFTHTAWGKLQGAPVDVMKIAQTTDGWIWLATATGLYRFDGARFESVESVYGHPLASTNVIGLMADSHDGLWVGYLVGGVTHFRPNESRSYGEAQGLPTGGVIHIEEGPDGAVWVGTRDGAAWLGPGAGRFRLLGKNEGLPEKFVYQILIAHDGTQWIASLQGLFFRKPGQLIFKQAWPRTRLLAVAEGPDGTIWARTRQYQYVRVALEAPADTIKPSFPGMGMRFSVDHTMWVLHTDGIERKFGPAGAAFPHQLLTQNLGMSGPQAQCFFQDRENNIWIGTALGLDRLTANRLKAIIPETALENPGIAKNPDGSVLLSDAIGNVKRYSDKGISQLKLRGIISASYYGDGDLLHFGTDRGIYTVNATQEIKFIEPPAVEKGVYPQSMVMDDSHVLWVSYSSGNLYRLVNNEWVRLNVKPSDASLALSMAKDSSGHIWLGYADNSIAIMTSNGELLRKINSVSDSNIGLVLQIIPDNEKMWIGGERGVGLFQAGHFSRLLGVSDEPFKGISGITRTTDGDLWMHGAEGIYHIAAAEIASWLKNKSARVIFKFYDAHDGLAGHASQLRPLPSILQTKDKKLLFTTNTGIFSIDPSNIHLNPTPPPVLVQSVTASGIAFSILKDKAVEIPNGVDNLHIQFTALSYSIPERIKFRYRLLGVDSDWQGPIARREAFYTNLRPGTYRFEVTAANENGVWNTRIQSIEIHIQPTFIQSVWFKFLLLGIAIALLYSVHIFRVRILTQRMQEKLSERARIARTLHDTLLQGIQGLILSFRAHSQLIPPESAGRAHIDYTLRAAEKLLVQGRDEIMDLRTKPTEDNLYSALSEFGIATTSERPHKFSAELSGDPRAINDSIYDEIFAIGREAICNASRYANARCIFLKITYSTHGLRLEVHDDGCGLVDAEITTTGRNGSWGIQGIQERALNMKAKLDIWSEVDSGTIVSLFVKAKVAYALDGKFIYCEPFLNFLRKCSNHFKAIFPFNLN